ncbi:MAG: hypothetical protein J6125_04620 [Clostridia bacterium]|nr:hypothetical protein [Clostridia bacterium]
MKRSLALLLLLTLTVLTLFSASSCKDKKTAITIAIPNDTTNEARALMLLESLGYIKLREGAGITATVLDVVENKYNITFREIEAAQIPNVRQDVDYAIINSNYAIQAGINPATAALRMEGSASAYGNILAVKAGRETEPRILALKAALESRQVKDYIDAHYSGSVVSIVDTLTDGYDATLDYDALSGSTVTVAASPTPHADILRDVVAPILATRGITLVIRELEDYVVPNEVVESGEADANYFQHLPYLNDFNANHNTHIVSIAAIHVEPMGLYGGKKTDLSPFN